MVTAYLTEKGAWIFLMDKHKNFGLSRVLEPRGVVPSTAWKVDNNPKVNNGEARIRLERINIEWDSFQQIVNSCSFDETKIKMKIIDIVEKRGKLHNPFTGTGGIMVGTIEEIAEDLEELTELKVGDRIYSLTSLCGVPMKIEKINSIDYNYGQIECDGYAILFEASPAYRLDETVSVDYALHAINEAGCPYSAYELANSSKAKRVVVMGINTVTTLIYAAAIKKASPKCEVVAIMDEDIRESLTTDEIPNLLSDVVDETLFADLSDPVNSYREILEKTEMTLCEGEFGADIVIVAEDIFGAETLGVFLAKEGGYIYFTTVQNHYGIAQTVAETMGKFVVTYAFDQYVENYPIFTFDVIKDVKPALDRINASYDSSKKHSEISESRANNIVLTNAGRNDDFIYQSRVTRNMVEEVMNVAKYDCNVIIQGETGVGKEKILSLIHQNSERHANPCIKINCATIQESLAESEFFGYEPGAFTGAGSAGKKGYFEMANNGILFLDEIGTLSMNMQSKLLRVLQENTFYRVGGTKQISVNVRVIVANNVPLKELVDTGKFREDLYYRLNICSIDVPPLRKRSDDIICLAESFTAGWAKKYGVERMISQDALKLLKKYKWPGNVRELENVVHRLVIGCKGTVITAQQVGDLLNENTFGSRALNLQNDLEDSNTLDFHEIMDAQEKRIIEYALKKGGTTRKAAEILGLPQTTFARKKLKHNL